MRSAWTRWLAGLAILGVAGCSSGKSWSMASLWPWGKSNSSAAAPQTSLAKNTTKPALPSANAKPGTLGGGQTQLASNTAAPSWNSGVAPAGGTGAWPNAAAAPVNANPYGTPPAGSYGANDPYGAVPAGNFGTPPAYTTPAAPGLGAAPGYGQTPNYNTSNYGLPPSTGALPGYSAPGANLVPGFTASPGTTTGVTPGFDPVGAGSYGQPQANPFAQPAAGVNYGPGAAAPGYAAPQTGTGLGATSQYPGTQPDYNNVLANNTGSSLPAAASGPLSVGGGLPTDSGALGQYPSTSGGSFAPGSTRPLADPAVTSASANGTQMAGSSSLTAPPAGYVR